MVVSQTFLLFNDLGSFEDYWSDILHDAPLLELDVFLMISPKGVARAPL